MRPQPNVSGDVRDFLTKVLDIRPGPNPRPLTAGRFSQRLAHLKEETRELSDAARRDDLPGMLDACVDLVYVAVGLAMEMNLPFDKAWKMVHAANMEKVHDPEARKLCRKPDGWEAPDVSRLL